ncbi:hypothetical protein [Stappia stellulata]|uniref:hypothetical protein n=1 Tax=Stappia stellulata TaxID=71235 RepID=UPI0009FC7FF1|nr:hypothetical protein [Stappia stellulata]
MPPIRSLYPDTNIFILLAELLVRPYRDRNDDLIQLYDNWIATDNTWLDVGPVTREVLWFAAVLRNQYPSVKLPDSIHLSTAIGLKCSHVLTTDDKLPREIELTHSRWGWSRSAPSLGLVSPTVQTLRAILDQRQ